MSNPTIDFDQIADGVTAVLNARAQRAQADQQTTERLDRDRAQYESHLARVQQIAAIRGEFAQLCNHELSLKVEIDTKFATLQPLQRELSVLGAQHSHLLGERARMQQQYPFLK
jgi:chromosome condensin MukBEF ATPase and DNA-binding subunit MukB